MIDETVACETAINTLQPGTWEIESRVALGCVYPIW